MSQQNKLMGVGQSAASAAQIVGDVASGLTATGTSQSGALPLSCACNYVETVASGTGVRLYGMTGRPSSIGDEQSVYNAGANTLSVYPPSGEQILGVSQDAAFSLPASTGLTFKKIKNGLWISLGIFVPSGTGALTETVQAALRRITHTSEYSTTANFNTASLALTGSVGMKRLVFPTVNTPTATFSLKSYDGSGQDTGQWGYNLSETLYVPNVLTEPQIWLGFEANFVNRAELYMRYSPIGNILSSGYVEPFFANVDRTSNKIVSVNLRGDIVYLGNTNDGSYTDYIQLTSSLCAITNPVTIGLGGSSPTFRIGITIKNDGFAAPSDANSTSNGDKLIAWNSSTLKVASGIDNGVSWFQSNGSATAAAAFKWYGGTTATPALHMSLSNAAALTVVGAFGCNGTTAQTAAASGGALAGYVAGANGLDTGAHMSALHALVVAMRAALVANGIMS